jgi:hypothetical protein
VNTFGRTCGTIDPVSSIRRVFGFGIKTAYDISPTAEVAGGSHGGSARASSGGGACIVLAWGGRRLAGLGGPKG